MLDNKGFFFPTLMVYIIIFLILISFMVSNNLANIMMLSSFEEEIGYEYSVLQSKEYISNQMKKGEEFKEVCKQQGVSNLNSQIKIYCILDITNGYVKKFEDELKAEGSLEVAKSKYQEQVGYIKKIEEKQISIFSDIDKKDLKTLSEEAGEISNYIVFDTALKSEKNSLEERILAIYDFKTSKVKIVTHI